MKSTGIVRRIDDLGRITLPKELRRALGIREGDPLELFVQGGSVVLTRYTPSCFLCGSDDERSVDHLGKQICRACIGKLDTKIKASAEVGD